jgi:hypothetical protein
MKTYGFFGRYASGIASLRSSTLWIHSLLAVTPAAGAAGRAARACSQPRSSPWRWRPQAAPRMPVRPTAVRLRFP